MILFNKENFKISGRYGILYIHKNNIDFFTTCIEINSMINIKAPNFLEIGIGLTYFYTGNYCSGCNYYKGDNNYLSAMFTVIRVGYRYQKEYGGLFGKIGVTPLIGIYDFNKDPSYEGPGVGLSNYFMGLRDGNILFVPLAGASIGYTFKKRNK